MEDESIFIYDVRIRAVWAVKGSKPRILVTGSHKRIAVYGALADNGAQLFRQYPSANGEGFLDYVKLLHRKFPKMILYMDSATNHKKDKRVVEFFRKHRKSIRVRWFPTGFPEANPMEECWKQGKDSVIGSRFYESFDEFRRTTMLFYRTRRFKLDLYKYLCH